MFFADLHCDTISLLLQGEREGERKSLRGGPGLHVTLEKLRKSGYLLQNFALFVDQAAADDPLAEALRLADCYQRELAYNGDLMAPVYTAEDLQDNRSAGKISGMLTVEGGEVCRGEPALLRVLFRLGVRLMTLTWNHPNALGWPHGMQNRPEYRKGKRYGLTERGEACLAEMESLGMLVDVSHLSDDGFWDVCRMAKKPFVASHSNARSLCGHSRNLTDEMIRTLADRGGVVGVNFYAPFLGEGPGSKTADIVRHMRHMVDVGGLSCVALGSDFDGIDSPLELEDSGGMSLLVQEMARQGLTEREREAICWRNVWELYQQVLPRRT